jgi:hypothetical protein
MGFCGCLAAPELRRVALDEKSVEFRTIHSRTHNLPFLKKAVEIRVPDLDQSEFGKGQSLLLLVCCLLKEFLDLRVKHVLPEFSQVPTFFTIASYFVNLHKPVTGDQSYASQLASSLQVRGVFVVLDWCSALDIAESEFRQQSGWQRAPQIKPQVHSRGELGNRSLV